MKKLFASALVLVLFSCTNETPDYTIVSGIMKNTEEGTFTITGLSFTKEIKVKDDGTFQDTLHLNYEGLYEIGKQPLYLEKGKNLRFEADAERIEEIKFEGDLAIENNYYVQKSQITNEVIGTSPREFYTLEEGDFIVKLDELEKKRNELIENTNFTTTTFKDKETRNILYHKNFLIENYSNYHGFLVGNQEYEVSDSFPKTDDNINFDNPEDFNFSSAYRNLVESNFQDNVQNAVNGGADYYETLMSNFKAKKSQNIKNALGKNLAYELSPSNKNLEGFYNELSSGISDENFKKELTTKYNKVKVLIEGKPSPKFVAYENHKGGVTSLDDLKGKYVYIDVWATWCGPCKYEIPFLKEVEQKFHDKNIEFVSISIDQKKDHQTWKEFVTEHQMVGTQLFADNDWKSQFVQDYVIEGIPRFILLDTEGNIISADAPRPSDEKLTEMLSEL